jgi:F0F1-type ATP synthase assembly protein I
MIWLWGLAVGLLLGTILGVVLARRPHRQRDQRSRGGTVTDWGQSLAQRH